LHWRLTLGGHSHDIYDTAQIIVSLAYEDLVKIVWILQCWSTHTMYGRL